MKTEDVRKLKDEEITVELDRLRAQVLAERTRAVSEKIEDTALRGKTRKQIARLLSERSARRKATAAK